MYEGYEIQIEKQQHNGKKGMNIVIAGRNMLFERSYLLRGTKTFLTNTLLDILLIQIAEDFQRQKVSNISLYI